MKVEIEDMRNDVSYPTSTKFTSLLEAANDLYVPETSEIPLATTGEIHREDATVDGSDAKTGEK